MSINQDSVQAVPRSQGVLDPPLWRPDLEVLQRHLLAPRARRWLGERRRRHPDQKTALPRTTDSMNSLILWTVFSCWNTRMAASTHSSLSSTSGEKAAGVICRVMLRTTAGLLMLAQLFACASRGAAFAPGARALLRPTFDAASSLAASKAGTTCRSPPRSFLSRTLASGRSSAAVAQDANKGSGKKQEKLDLQPPKGTRDFYPEEMRLRNWLFGHWKEVARIYGFEEYDSPVLESEALYIRKAGEEVTQQLYNFEDKGGRRVALRPEMTPSLARMVMAKGKGLTLPVKWFSLPQCWRYERMTRGRRREHFQWNMDMWGVSGVEAEAELLGAITTFFSRVGVTSKDVGIKINSRAVLQEVARSIGVPDDKFAATCVLVDKLDKVKVEDIQGDMEALGLSKEVVEGLLETLAIKDFDELAKKVGEDSDGMKQLRKLFDLAEAYGFRDWLVFDASVVRGLAYYTGVVFEGFDRRGELRAICGGGRYDMLLESFGGEPLPACGFGFGDAVIVELLKDLDLLPPLQSGVDVVIFPYGEEQRPLAMQMAASLRAKGVSTDLIMEDGKKSKWVFKHVERLGAAKLIMIGDRDVEAGTVNVKDLAGGEQESVSIDGVADHLDPSK